MEFIQNYDPFGNAWLSTIVATLPVLTLFVMLVPMRLLAPWAALGGAVVALVLAVTAYKMPPGMAAMAFLNGALFGLMPVCWTIICAMLLYNTTVETGLFDKIKLSVAGLSADHRLQAIMIGFSFGAFLEGAAGGGTPVAICAAMMVGLGFDPFLAAGLCLIANTSPVAYGGFGTPLITLTSVTDIDTQTLSHMAGNQLPFLSFIIPLWLVRCMCNWKETLAVWPAILVSGGSFAVCQFVFAHSSAYPLTDIAGGLISLVVTGAFLVWWKPREVWRFETHRPPPGKDPAPPVSLPGRMPLGEVFRAWLPWIILCGLMTAVGLNKPRIDGDAKRNLPTFEVASVRVKYDVPMPWLHLKVTRQPPVVEKDTQEKAIWTFNWITTPGTSVFVTTLIALAYLRPTREQLRRIIRRTVYQMAIPVPTIVCMLGLSYVTRYSGMDATLGMAFKGAGAVYPFFAAILGWLGVFLTGTDAGSNALFGSLQKITATQIHSTHLAATGLSLAQSQVLICVANSTGGVMGKMIDAQSICVATAATERVGTEADLFKFVVWHSIILAAIVGLLVLAQAYWLTGMVPVPPG